MATEQPEIQALPPGEPDDRWRRWILQQQPELSDPQVELELVKLRNYRHAEYHEPSVAARWSRFRLHEAAIHASHEGAETVEVSVADLMAVLGILEQHL